MAKRSFYVKDSELDDYQVKVINKKTDNSYIVKGCAGSGKSILALWKAKQIQEEHKGSYLYIVKTKALRQYMNDGIQQVGLTERNVVNFDACFSWTKDDYGNWERGAWKKGIYDYIILDEAQDFSKEEIEVMKSKARKAFLIYGDTAQQLYDFDKSKIPVSMEDIQYFTRFPVEQLVFNHRLPKKIARVAEYLNTENDELETRCTEEGTDRPKFLSYNSKEEEYNAIISLIKNRSMEDVGILFRTKRDVDDAYEYLTAHGLEVEANSGVHQGEFNFLSDNPKLMTYHSSKCLQFEYVFLPECSVEGSDNRNPLYVAVTRTYRGLFVMHSGNLSSLFDDVPEDLYDTSLVAAGPKLKL